MVHSGSTSPMKTTPSASPHLTVPATEPALVPPPGGTDQDQTQTPTKHVTLTHPSDSDFPQLSTLTPADAEPPVVTPTKTPSTVSSPASSWPSTQTPTPVQPPVNGRTSGRKRTPKACDCCGPNSAGHHVRTLARGKGRGRARGSARGTNRDIAETSKRKVDQLTHINNFDLSKEITEEARDEDDTPEKVQISAAVPGTPAKMPVSLQHGPITNCVASEKDDSQKKEEMLIEGSGVAVALEKGLGGCRDVEMRLPGMSDSSVLGVRGPGSGTVTPSKTEGDIKVKKLDRFNIVITSKTNPLVLPVSLQGVKQDPQIHHVGQNVSTSAKCSVGNGDTVNLSDTEGEVEDSVVVTESGNGHVSISLQSASRSGAALDRDSEMQVDQTSDRTDQGSLSETLSNGNIAAPIKNSDGSMEVETSHSARVSSPDHIPITVNRLQYGLAIRDHRLYCLPGTWEKDEMMEISTKSQAEQTEMDGKMEIKESVEQLMDIIHDFLESFYIKYASFTPLSESDVLEHLKEKGISDLNNSGLDIKREMARYRAGLASAPVASFMVMHNKHTLSLEDLGTLEEQNWLNDQIINMYGELIMEETEQKVHFFNSFFHKQLVAKGYDGVKRWTKKVDLFSKWLLLIPIHLEIHWSLVTVTMATKTISYYDSQGIVFRHTTDNIMKYLQSEAREKKQAAFQKGWKITIIKGIPQQKNDSDCGVFVLEYCRRLSVKQPLLFSQEDMPRIRKRIYKELCDCRLND